MLELLSEHLRNQLSLAVIHASLPLHESTGRLGYRSNRTQVWTQYWHSDDYCRAMAQISHQ
jgi:hypothetical protein